MKIILKITLVTAVMAALAVAASAQSWNLKRTVKVGDTSKYKLSVNANFGGQDVTIGGTTIEKVLKVEADGKYQIESKQTGMKVSFGGQDMDIPDQGASTTTFKPNNEIIEIKGEGSDASAYRLSNMNVVTAPEKEVKVGDKWTYEVKADAKTGTVAGKGEYEILGADKFGDYECVKVKWTYKETEGTEPASASGTVWLNVKDGTLVKVSGEYKNAPVPGAPGPMDMKFNLERVG